MRETPVRKVVVTGSGWKKRILKRAKAEGLGELEVVECGDRDDTLKQLADADVAVVPPWDAEMFHAAKNLRWVHTNNGGVESFLFPEFIESLIPFSCGKPTFAIPGAEFALAAMLMFTRRNHFAIGPPKTSHWLQPRDRELRPEDLAGKTVGILALGHMGRALAPRAASLGTHVIGVTRRPRTSLGGIEEMFTLDQLPELLSRSDFVVLAIPLTEETRGMINESVFEQMKETAFLIDLSGRPALFDYPALVRAIEEKWIAGICTQPSGHLPDLGMPPIDSGFWQLENVVVSPCRGTSQVEAGTGMDLFLENLQRFQAGQPLEGLVDKQAGY